MRDFFEDVFYGCIKIAKALGLLLVFLAALCGFVLIPPMLFGKIAFEWWYIPCWVIDLAIIAACIGENR